MNDDLDEEIIGQEDEFDEFAQKSSLGDKIRQSPLAKAGVVVGAIVVVAGVSMLFGGETQEQMKSRLPGGKEITSVPATDSEVAPAYIEAVDEQNEANLTEAMRTGGSSIPVPIETPETRLEVPDIQEETEDPLYRWRLLQEERVERQMKAADTEIEPVTVLDAGQQSDAIKKLADSMSQQMESVLSKSSAAKNMSTLTFRYEDEEDAGVGAGGPGDGSDGDFGFEEEEEKVVIIPAGKIVYGQLLLEANSDVPNTVLAQMVSGPLKGWKMLGQFEVFDDLNMLGITFNMAVNEDGKQYAIDAIMLNPDTGLSAMRTDIDYRFMRRVLLPAAAAFVEGYAEAVSESGLTTVTVTGETVIEEEEETSNDQEVAAGVSEAGSEIAEILEDMGDVDVKIIIEAGTPVGVFFLENVNETEGDI